MGEEVLPAMLAATEFSALHSCAGIALHWYRHLPFTHVWRRIDRPFDGFHLPARAAYLDLSPPTLVIPAKAGIQPRHFNPASNMVRGEGICPGYSERVDSAVIVEMARISIDSRV
jgi:hypothetical protein